MYHRSTRLVSLLAAPPTPPPRLPQRRAVQFCDPPVSDSVEIPLAGRQLLRAARGRGRGRGRGRRGLKLDTSQEFEESPPPPPEAAGPAGLCPRLAGCEDAVTELVDQLTSASWRTGLVRLLSARGINTVGQLAGLPVAQLAELPVRSPRIATVETALNDYLAVWEKR